MNCKNNKVFIIGLDGGTWDVLKPLMDEGKMPGLARLIRQGVSGELQSTIPPITAPAWASFVTGMNPGKHGIFDFRKFDRRTRQVSLVNATHIRARTIWEIVSEHGKKVIAINVPLSYPPKKINGIMVSGLMNPSFNSGLNSRVVFPAFVYDEIKPKFSHYQLFVSQDEYYQKGLMPFLHQTMQVTRYRADLALYLMRHYDWDLFMVHFQNVDTLQHALWCYLDKTYPGFDEEKYNCVSQYFQLLDKIISQFMQELPEATTTIILSDHGFGPRHAVFNLQAWLRQQKLLALSERGNSLTRLIASPLNWGRKLGLSKLRSIFIPDQQALKWKQKMEWSNSHINWSQTKVFAFSGPSVLGFIYLMNKDSQPGPKRCGVSENLRNYLLTELTRLKDPQTGETVVQHVYIKEKIYQGPLVRQAPDLIVEMKPGYMIHSNTETMDFFKRIDPGVQDSGMHSRTGIVIFYGQQIQQNAIVSSARIIDLAPTILFALGVPIPEEMDGVVLNNVWTPLFLEANAPVYSFDEQQTNYIEEPYCYSLEEHTVVEKRLRDLGYVD